MINSIKNILSQARELKINSLINNKIHPQTKKELHPQMQDSYNLYMYDERTEEKIKNSDTKIRSIVSLYFMFNSKVFHLGVGIDYDKVKFDNLNFTKIEFKNKASIEDDFMSYIKDGLNNNVKAKTKALAEYDEFIDEMYVEITQQLFKEDTSFIKELDQFKIIWEKGAMSNVILKLSKPKNQVLKI